MSELAEKLSRSSVIFATDYRGLSVGEMAELRRQLRQQGVEYRVVKNTLVNLAAAKVGKPALATFLKGPTALAFGYGDVAPLVKVITDYQRSAKALSIKGALLSGRALSADEISFLSTLPPREVLLSQVLGALYSAIYGLLSVLTAEQRGLLSVLQVRIEQLQGG